MGLVNFLAKLTASVLCAGKLSLIRWCRNKRAAENRSAHVSRAENSAALMMLKEKKKKTAGKRTMSDSWLKILLLFTCFYVTVAFFPFYKLTNMKHASGFTEEPRTLSYRSGDFDSDRLTVINRLTEENIRFGSLIHYIFFQMRTSSYCELSLSWSEFRGQLFHNCFFLAF